jgi:hypothetical protein
MALPKVSVVIPCYNCADTLRETVASIAAQNYASLELLLVNDGSTDGTAALFCLTPSIGDSLLISAIIAQVKQQFPTVRITVCAEQHIQDLLRHHPAVERYIPPGGLEEFVARLCGEPTVGAATLSAPTALPAAPLPPQQ